MQISAKIWDYSKNNKNSKFKRNILGFGISLESKEVLGTWIEIILPRSYKNIDKDTIFIKFWNANIGKNLGLFKKIIKI